MINRFSIIEQDIISKVICLIQQLHINQTYGDHPYYLHPIEVAGTLINPTFIEYVAALFHDTVEDCGTTVKDIADGYGTAVAEIVALLTKVKGIPYADNIQRIIVSGNVGAMKVKLADNRVNLSNQPKEHNIPKYMASIAALEYALVMHGEEI